MSYICLDCGRIFEDGEQKTWSESRGEFWGVSCSEEMSGCPDCGGDYEEITLCEICGEEEAGKGGVCKKCIDEHRKDFDLCYKIGAEEPEEIKINSLLKSLFEPSDIEAILVEYIKNQWKDVDCSPFIDSDIGWFAENLIEEVNKNEKGKN